MNGEQGAGGQPGRPNGASETAAVYGHKSIVLFSDGTGNSSGKLFKTNVWRMYEAVDLGPPKGGGRKQIAFYDDGVGTSGFKPLAILGGVFGVGLRRNVLDIYRYACRNYKPAEGQEPGQAQWGRTPGGPGDHIYGFGFSRGAFTMRIAIAMIARVGLAVTGSEAELDRKAREAWRVFRKRYRPRSPLAPANLWRRWVRGSGTADRQDLEALQEMRSRNFHPVIRFVGVWDTVSAYGGPISEITEAIDNWIVRLSMPNYELADSVQCARHALALDDERDAFHPLLWDEIYEAGAVDAAAKGEKPGWIDEERLEQVWFTGMHSDVGGGYPDESLSYVSFLWMMEEAQEAGLRPSPAMIERFQALANSAGPIHDSRAGVGSYYRYQPRRIDVWMEPLEGSLLTRRHPDRQEGLIRVAKVHDSVAARIASGTDRYAPISLPAKVRVVPPQRMSEASQSTGTGPSGEPEGTPTALIPDPLRRRFEDEALGRRRALRMAAVWDQVKRRRRLYFISLFLTLALVSMPLWDHLFLPPVLASGHGLLGRTIAMLGVLLPGFLAGIVESWANHPFFVLVLGAALFLTNRRASRIERSLRDDTHRIWNQALGVGRPNDRSVESVRAAGDFQEQEAQVARASEATEQVKPTAWQKASRFFRWRVVPALILAGIAAMMFWLLAILATRISLSFLERGEALCPGGPPAVPGTVSDAVPDAVPGSFDFTTRGPCHATGLDVVKDQRYVVEFNVGQGWWDGDRPTDPRGLAARDLGLAGYIGAPLRRAVGARYLQPVAHIRGGNAGPALQPIELKQVGTPVTMWRGEFKADRTGSLSLFANEAMLPFPLGEKRPVTIFYTHDRHGNWGTAKVTVRRARDIGAAPEAAAHAPPPGR